MLNALFMVLFVVGCLDSRYGGADVGSSFEDVVVDAGFDEPDIDPPDAGDSMVDVGFQDPDTQIVEVFDVGGNENGEDSSQVACESVNDCKNVEFGFGCYGDGEGGSYFLGTAEVQCELGFCVVHPVTCEYGCQDGRCIFIEPSIEQEEDCTPAYQFAPNYEFCRNATYDDESWVANDDDCDGELDEGCQSCQNDGECPRDDNVENRCIEYQGKMHHFTVYEIGRCFNGACARYPFLEECPNGCNADGCITVPLPAIGSCNSDEDCQGSPWGQVCVRTLVNGGGLICQQCEQGRDGMAIRGCDEDHPACGWGIRRDIPDGSGWLEEPRSVYECRNCWEDSCGDGKHCDIQNDVCVPD